MSNCVATDAIRSVAVASPSHDSVPGQVRDLIDSDLKSTVSACKLIDVVFDIVRLDLLRMAPQPHSADPCLRPRHRCRLSDPCCLSRIQ